MVGFAVVTVCGSNRRFSDLPRLCGFNASANVTLRFGNLRFAAAVGATEVPNGNRKHASVTITSVISANGVRDSGRLDLSAQLSR